MRSASSKAIAGSSCNVTVMMPMRNSSGRTGPTDHRWAHARRRFVKRLEKDSSPITEEALRQIDELYALEFLGHVKPNRVGNAKALKVRW